MASVPTAGSVAPELPFRFISGDPSLDLVNTADWTRSGLASERLTDYPALLRWAQGADVVAPALAGRLETLAEARPRKAAAAVEAARRLRALLQMLFTEVAAGRPPHATALADFNALLGDVSGRLRLASGAAPGLRGPQPAGSGSLEWGWQGAQEHLEAPLWPVTWSAAVLLASPEAAQVRLCGAPDCGWMYVDRSRNRLRRWCQMETCGTREKSRRRADRTRSE
jgi:predicted RNA-binding Zn ribbon-like protein